ncbi:UNVERIFIED_CONTAM: hypothetical protein GTU68_057532 [Idotea baltica]|nr:hypothetical protein [Idotea baltica]
MEATFYGLLRPVLVAAQVPGTDEFLQGLERGRGQCRQGLALARHRVPIRQRNLTGQCQEI